MMMNTAMVILNSLAYLEFSGRNSATWSKAAAIMIATIAHITLLTFLIVTAPRL
jgi:hypothetical protein